ncbi:MAG: glutamine amidotransferase [Thermoprotei archaeon]
MKEKIRVLYVGDSGTLALTYVGSPFWVEQKNFDVWNFALPFIEALKKDSSIDVTYMPTWEAYKNFPKTLDELMAYDVLLLSDIEYDSIIYYPDFYNTANYGKFITLPNRVKNINEFVKRGGGLAMLGGWQSFAGKYGHAMWQHTPVEEALPVNMLDRDDRVETPEGAYVKVVNGDHPITRGIDWESAPPLLGYNKILLKKSAELLATIGGGDVLMAAGDYYSGRTFAFASDPSPHWGINFMNWKYYDTLWRQAVKWLGKAL